MTIGRIIVFSLIAAVAGSYTWGMRGTILGGERGGMLPGAALGLLLAFATGDTIVSGAFFIPAAAGAAAMFFGGAQSYGQTISLSYDRENKKRRLTGRIGLTIKGANWFGIYGGVMAVCFGAMAGRYSVAQICLFTVLLPLSKWFGFFVLNYPQKPLEKKFPKLYFSEGRFEVWGGMLFVNLMIIIFAAVKREWFAVIMTLAGLISGGAGFLVGNILQTSTPEEGINGKYLLGKLQKNGFVGSWKLMEFTMGAIGGLGTTLCFCLCYNRIVSVYVTDILANSGVWSPMSDGVSSKLSLVWLVLLLVFSVRYVLPPVLPYFPEIKAKLKSGEISESRYLELAETATEIKPSTLMRLIDKSDEYLIWPVFSYVPILLTLLCDISAARLISFFLIFWVLADEIIFTPGYAKKIPRSVTAFRAVLGGLGVLALALQLLAGISIPAIVVWIMYFISYEAAECWMMLAPEKLKPLIAENGSTKAALLSLKSAFSGRVYSLLCVAAMIIAGAIILA